MIGKKHMWVFFVLIYCAFSHCKTIAIDVLLLFIMPRDLHQIQTQQAHDMISTLKLCGYRVATSYNMISTSLQRRFTYVGSTWK